MTLHCTIDGHTSLEPALLLSPCPSPSPDCRTQWYVQYKQYNPTQYKTIAILNDDETARDPPYRTHRTHQDAAGGAVVHQLADHVEVRHQGSLQDERHVRRVEQLDGESTLLAPVLLVLDLGQKTNNTGTWLRDHLRKNGQPGSATGHWCRGTARGNGHRHGGTSSTACSSLSKSD